MYVADTKRLTHQGAKTMVDAAVAKARAAGIAISFAVVDAGGHLVAFERMDGGRFHTLHSSTTKAVCAASNKRVTTAKGAVGQDLDTNHALGSRARRGTGALDRHGRRRAGDRSAANASAASASAAATGRPTSASRAKRWKPSARIGSNATSWK